MVNYQGICHIGEGDESQCSQAENHKSYADFPGFEAERFSVDALYENLLNWFGRRRAPELRAWFQLLTFDFGIQEFLCGR